jgi:proteasome accessory factor C
MPGQAATSAERLQRLLALVPYVVSRKAVGLADTAAAFGLSERELVDDLNLLWCVELRDPDPYCPIDLSYEGGEIVVSQAESIGRPLRLAVDEASALLVALRMLADVPGLEDRSALSRVIAKLEAAAGEAAGPSAQVAVQVDRPNGDEVIVPIREALDRRRRLHLRYYVPGRDEATERDVDPMRLLVVEGRAYLEGWCRRADGVRLFRVDRILGIDVLEVPASVPDGARPVDVDQGLFRPSPDDVHVALDVSAAGRWVAEYYPCESVTELGDGWLRVQLRTPDTRWVRRLALRLGEDGRVTAPDDLRTRIRDDAAAALAHYALLPLRPRSVTIASAAPAGSVTGCERYRFHRNRHPVDVDTAHTGVSRTRRYGRNGCASCRRISQTASSPTVPVIALASARRYRAWARMAGSVSGGAATACGAARRRRPGPAGRPAPSGWSRWPSPDDRGPRLVAGAAPAPPSSGTRRSGSAVPFSTASTSAAGNRRASGRSGPVGRSTPLAARSASSCWLRPRTAAVSRAVSFGPRAVRSPARRAGSAVRCSGRGTA